MTGIKKPKFKNKLLKDLLPQLQIAAAFWLVLLSVFLLPQHPGQALAAKSSPDAFPNDVNFPPYPTQILPASLTVSSSSYTSLDVTSGQFLLSSNADSLHAPASTAKLMLAWITRRHCDLNQVLTVKQSFHQGTVLGLTPSQKFTIHDLLYALLLPSNNDVALALADGCFGSSQNAVTAMNQQAQAWKLVNTHFANVHGLDDPANYSTAHDLALLAKFAMTDPVLSQIVSTASFTFTSPDGQTYHLKSTNQLLGQDGITGIKTGSTDDAGQNFIGRAPVRGHTIITVVLGSTDRFVDTHKLLLEILKVYRWYDTASVSPNSKLHEN